MQRQGAQPGFRPDTSIAVTAVTPGSRIALYIYISTSCLCLSLPLYRSVDNTFIQTGKGSDQEDLSAEVCFESVTVSPRIVSKKCSACSRTKDLHDDARIHGQAGGPAASRGLSKRITDYWTDLVIGIALQIDGADGGLELASRTAR